MDALIARVELVYIRANTWCIKFKLKLFRRGAFLRLKFDKGCLTCFMVVLSKGKCITA